MAHSDRFPRGRESPVHAGALAGAIRRARREAYYSSRRLAGVPRTLRHRSSRVPHRGAHEARAVGGTTSTNFARVTRGARGTRVSCGSQPVDRGGVPEVRVTGASVAPPGACSSLRPPPASDVLRPRVAPARAELGVVPRRKNLCSVIHPWEHGSSTLVPRGDRPKPAPSGRDRTARSCERAFRPWAVQVSWLGFDARARRPCSDAFVAIKPRTVVGSPPRSA